MSSPERQELLRNAVSFLADPKVCKFSNMKGHIGLHTLYFEDTIFATS
jgi:hypothetical protein